MMLDIHNLSVSIAGQHLLQDITAQIGPGFTAIVGPNGAGKSTLLQALAGLLAPAQGRASWQGRNLMHMPARERAGLLAWQAQNPEVHWPVNVRTLVRMARANRTEAHRMRDQHVDRALQTTGMQVFAERNVRTLSGGELARALLAHTLASNVDLLLVDEPVAALDPAAALSQLQVLKHEADTGRTILCVLHDMQWVRAFADQALVLEGGRLRAHDTPKVLLGDGVMQSVFGVAFAPDGAMVLPT